MKWGRGVLHVIVVLQSTHELTLSYATEQSKALTLELFNSLCGQSTYPVRYGFSTMMPGKIAVAMLLMM